MPELASARWPCAAVPHVRPHELLNVAWKANAGPNATISRAVRKTPKVIDESAVILHLKTHGLDHDYVAPRLTDHFEMYAKEAMKQGIQVEGLQYQETEYLSITEANSGKDRRKVTIEQ